AVTGVSVSDANTGATLTVTLSDRNGLLSANTSRTEERRAGTGTASTTLKIVGTQAQVDADLMTLTDNDSSIAADSITVTATDNLGATATPASIAVSVSPPPVITAPASVLLQQGLGSAVAGVSVSDANTGATLTVTLADRNGLLSANTSAPGGGGTITGTASTPLKKVGRATHRRAHPNTATHNARQSTAVT